MRTSINHFIYRILFENLCYTYVYIYYYNFSYEVYYKCRKYYSTNENIIKENYISIKLLNANLEKIEDELKSNKELWEAEGDISKSYIKVKICFNNCEVISKAPYDPGFRPNYAGDGYKFALDDVNFDESESLTFSLVDINPKTCMYRYI